jgi:hypothetical protein
MEYLYEITFIFEKSCVPTHETKHYLENFVYKKQGFCSIHTRCNCKIAHATFLLYLFVDNVTVGEQLSWRCQFHYG